jgi:hypothetical protein
MKKENNAEIGNIFNAFNYVFSEESIKDYYIIMKNQKGDSSTLTNDAEYKSYFNTYWKRGQLSDHNPVWVEIVIDSSDMFLKNKLKKFK